MNKIPITNYTPDKQGELLHKEATQVLLPLIPKEELDRVVGSHFCEIDLEFLGFVGNYHLLSQMIPQHFTVVDLGCAYAPQSYLFHKHKGYIGVDVVESEERFNQDVLHCKCTISEFLSSELFTQLDLDTTFFICQYVPKWYDHNIKNVLSKLKNVFSFYPAG